jgi:hypothetical protein
LGSNVIEDLSGIDELMPSDPRDYKLDISGSGETGSSPRPSSEVGSRPYLSVHFACCGAYQRIYRDPDGKHYQGRCPRCARPVRFVIGEGGTATRCFVVS